MKTNAAVNKQMLSIVVKTKMQILASSGRSGQFSPQFSNTAFFYSTFLHYQ